jgi:hypothetical protein
LLSRSGHSQTHAEGLCQQQQHCLLLLLLLLLVMAAVQLLQALALSPAAAAAACLLVGDLLAWGLHTPAGTVIHISFCIIALQCGSAACHHVGELASSRW